MLVVVVGAMVVVVMVVMSCCVVVMVVGDAGMVVGGAAGALDMAPWLQLGGTSFGGVGEFVLEGLGVSGVSLLGTDTLTSGASCARAAIMMNARSTASADRKQQVLRRAVGDRWGVVRVAAKSF
ncbi:hypothetical protein CYMTET_24281, partial [Cymbomonas tetramitiformis]